MVLSLLNKWKPSERKNVHLPAVSVGNKTGHSIIDMLKVFVGGSPEVDSVSCIYSVECRGVAGVPPPFLMHFFFS